VRLHHLAVDANGNRLFIGNWDHHVYAIDAHTGRKIWSFQADDQVNTSAAYWKGRIYIASDGGTLYSLSAKTGKLLWQADGRPGDQLGTGVEAAGDTNHDGTPDVVLESGENVVVFRDGERSTWFTQRGA